MEPLPAATVAAVERWFIRRGIPHFIAGYNAREDVLTRALPFLVIVFVAEVALAARPDWPWWANSLAVAAGATILLGGFGLLNRARGRGTWQRPGDVGAWEIAAFLLLPPLLPAVTGGDLAGEVALGAVLANLLLLGGAYLVTSYGVVPMLRWAAVRTLRQVTGIANLMIRSLPLLLLFAGFLFINAELWQVAADFTPQSFGATLALLVGVGALFFLVRLPREMEGLRAFRAWSDAAALLDGTPLAADSVLGMSEPPRPPQLGLADRVNVSLLLAVAQGVQIVLVAGLIAMFFTLFGLITIREATVLAWTGRDALADPLARLVIADTEVVLTVELLRVAAFIGAFGGLHFTVSALTDEVYRREFAEEVVAEIRQAFAVRAVYLARIPG